MTTLKKKPRKQIRKKVIRPKTPEGIAMAIHKTTKNSQPVGANSHNQPSLYDKDKYSEDKTRKDIETVNESPMSRLDTVTTPPHKIEYLKTALLEYSRDPKNIVLSGFFRVMEIPWSTFKDLMKNNLSLALAYEMARENLAENNIRLLNTDLNPAMASKVSKLHTQFSSVCRDDRRSDLKFEQRVKLEAVREIIKEKNNEESKESKVVVEVKY